MMNSTKYFDKVAPQWDRLRESFFTKKVRDKAISVVNVQPGQIAADIGCGTGFITEGLIKRDLKVIAVDRSQAMLSEMKQKFADIDLIDYRLGEASLLPIQDETLDYAFANMYLHHVEVPLQAIIEMVRILKPGGRVVITDLDEHDCEFLRIEHNDLWMGFKREEIRRWLQEAGLRDIVVNCAGENCCAVSLSKTEHAKINIFVAAGKK